MSSHYDISRYKHEDSQSPLMRTLRSIYSDFQLVDDENGKLHEFSFAHYYIVEHDGTEVYIDDGGYGCEVSGTGYRRRGYRRIIRRNACIQEQLQNIIENKEKGFSKLELLTDAVRKIFVQETRKRLGLVVPDNDSKKRSDELSAKSDGQQEQMHLKRLIWEVYLDKSTTLTAAKEFVSSLPKPTGTLHEKAAEIFCDNAGSRFIQSYNGASIGETKIEF